MKMERRSRDKVFRDAYQVHGQITQTSPPKGDLLLEMRYDFNYFYRPFPASIILLKSFEYMVLYNCREGTVGSEELWVYTRGKAWYPGFVEEINKELRNIGIKLDRIRWTNQVNCPYEEEIGIWKKNLFMKL